MAPLDWAIIGLYVVLVSGVGFLFVRKASGSTAEFFVAGRNLPWWIAGTSLIAASFAADTPLAITKIVADHGIAGNWLWWNQMVVWILAVVFFARLWRRSGLVTDAEFIELRYGGAAGALLRGFKAFYYAFLISTITLGWVMLGMQKIVSATMDAPGWVLSAQTSIEAALGLEPGSILAWKWVILIALFLATTAYTTVSGVWGIMVTDLIQMAVAFGGAILLAVFCAHSVGGIEALKGQLTAQYGAAGTTDLLRFVPRPDSSWMPLSTFAIYLGVLWWGDCGGFVAQKMFATRSDRDSTLAALWYAFIHFGFRPWAWVVVALVALVVYPQLDDRELAYPMLMMKVLPTGLRGLMFAALLAAFMSTANTHLNWNASYFVNDIYKRFLRPQATERQCVRMSRLATLGFAALAIAVAYCLNSIADAWLYLFNLQAGIGLVLMLRWFWWRVSVWSEVSAMLTSLAATPAFRHLCQHLRETHGAAWATDAFCILITAATCTAVWLVVTWLTPPPPEGKLDAFYRRVRPNGWWGPVARRCPEVVIAHPGLRTVMAWVAGTGALCLAMFTMGKLVLGEWGTAAACLAGSLLLTWLAYQVGTAGRRGV